MKNTVPIKNDATLTAIRASGDIDIFDIDAVQTMTTSHDDPATAEWVANNRETYLELMSSWLERW